MTTSHEIRTVEWLVASTLTVINSLHCNTFADKLEAWSLGFLTCDKLAPKASNSIVMACAE